jgi:hypothetical protein
MLSVAQIICCQVISLSMTSELERIGKEALVKRFTIVIRFTWVTEKTKQLS